MQDMQPYRSNAIKVSGKQQGIIFGLIKLKQHKCKVPGFWKSFIIPTGSMFRCYECKKIWYLEEDLLGGFFDGWITYTDNVFSLVEWKNIGGQLDYEDELIIRADKL